MHIAADVKHPCNMSRGEKLKMITALSKTQGANEAMKFWLTHCPKISRKAFNEAIK